MSATGLSAPMVGDELVAAEQQASDELARRRGSCGPPTVAVADVRDAWLATFAASEATQRTYRGALERFERWAIERYGQLDADALTLHGVAEYHAHLATQRQNAARARSRTSAPRSTR